ncbi:MAG: hypothetical protein AB7K36_19865 [Chloroflexota bacterium]
MGRRTQREDPGGSIVCAREADGWRLRFEVHDTGVGVDPDVLEQFSLPFEQADR